MKEAQYNIGREETGNDVLSDAYKMTNWRTKWREHDDEYEFGREETGINGGNDASKTSSASLVSRTGARSSPSSYISSAMKYMELTKILKSVSEHMLS